MFFSRIFFINNKKYLKYVCVYFHLIIFVNEIVRLYFFVMSKWYSTIFEPRIPITQIFIMIHYEKKDIFLLYTIYFLYMYQREPE